MQFKVSVIIPVFNDQPNLENCLSALKRQNTDPALLEVIVVDNASSPPMVLPSAKPVHTRLIVCGTPGSYAARNAGASAAQGEYLGFIDADCWPSDSWIFEGLRVLRANEEDCFLGGEILLHESDRPTAVELYQHLVGFGQKTNIEENGFTATANLFVKKNVFELIGQFNEALLSCGDREWCWRAQKLNVDIIFAQKAIIFTYPRRSLRAAIIQARRVAGGRYYLKKNLPFATKRTDGSKNQRKRFWQKIWTILFDERFSVLQRLRILFCACVIKSIHELETVRLSFGGVAERR
jgi:glycosyltransferase involved in cell wall biosynthesis